MFPEKQGPSCEAGVGQALGRCRGHHSPWARDQGRGISTGHGSGQLLIGGRRAQCVGSPQLPAPLYSQAGGQPAQLGQAVSRGLCVPWHVQEGPSLQCTQLRGLSTQGGQGQPGTSVLLLGSHPGGYLSPGQAGCANLPLLTKNST